jgi:hypothetical protein
MIEVSTSGFRSQRGNYISEGHISKSMELFTATATGSLSRFCLAQLTGYNLSTLRAVKFTANQQQLVAETAN